MIRIMVAVLLCLGSLVYADSVSLINGENLDGWQSVGDIEWFVEDGAAVASGPGDGFLRSEAGYGDFYLRVEFWVDETTNSGIFIRCKDPLAYILRHATNSISGIDTQSRRLALAQLYSSSCRLWQK